MGAISKTQKTAKQTNPKKALYILLAFIGVLFAGSLTAAFFLLGRKAPEAPSLVTPTETAKYLASKEFATLSQEQKTELMKNLREQNKGRPFDRDAEKSLSEDEKKQLHQNMGEMFRAEMKKRVDTYFSLPKEQREAYLDQVIKERRAREAERAARGGNQHGGSQPGQQAGQGQNQPGQQPQHGGPPRRSPTEFRNMMQNTDPSDRARMAEFRKAEHLREQQLKQQK